MPPPPPSPERREPLAAAAARVIHAAARHVREQRRRAEQRGDQRHRRGCRGCGRATSRGRSTPCSSSRSSVSSSPRVTAIAACAGSRPTANAFGIGVGRRRTSRGFGRPDAIAISSTTLMNWRSAGSFGSAGRALRRGQHLRRAGEPAVRRVDDPEQQGERRGQRHAEARVAARRPAEQEHVEPEAQEAGRAPGSPRAAGPSCDDSRPAARRTWRAAARRPLGERTGRRSARPCPPRARRGTRTA